MLKGVTNFRQCRYRQLAGNLNFWNITRCTESNGIVKRVLKHQCMLFTLTYGCRQLYR